MIRQFALTGLTVVLSGLLCFPSVAFSAKTKKRMPKRPPAATQEEKESPRQEAPAEPKPEEKPQTLGPEDGRTEQEKQDQAKTALDASGSNDKEQAEEDREMEAEEAQRLTELFLRNQSVFIRKGELMVELNTFYNRNSRQDFQPFPGGGALLVKNTTKFIDNSMIVRYGLLTDGLELDLIIPYWIHGEVKSDFGVAQSDQSKDGFGDLAAALRYEVWYEQGNRPSLILDISGKSRTGGTGLTGTGTWNMGGGVTLLKTIDPVVFFGRIGYVNNFASETRNLGNIFEYRLGMGFSLNDKVSFNIQLSGANIAPSTVASPDISGITGPLSPTVLSVNRLELMNLLFTTTIIVTRRFSIEPVVGVPLTNESFTSIGIRIPYRF
jgi:hypothetical protein